MLFGSTVAWGAGQTPPSAPVTVVNTTANPVPVTGTIGLSGTANVTVTNTGSNPLPVVTLNLDDSVLNAFQTRVLFGGGNPQSDKEFTVPTGKRLVIQSITATVEIGVGQRPELFLRLRLGANATNHVVPLTFVGLNFFNRDQYQALHSTRWFADGGTKVEFVARALVGPDTTGTDVSVSGYLVDVN